MEPVGPKDPTSEEVETFFSRVEESEGLEDRGEGFEMKPLRGLLGVLAISIFANSICPRRAACS